jgi:hypothetical protein
MSIINHHELHKFVMGEIRTDGWRSDWRIELERRRQEERDQAKKANEEAA